MNSELRQQMEAYTNERILNNIKQREFFSVESVEIAKEIALERKLVSPQQIDDMAKLSDMKIEAKKLTDMGYDPGAIQQNLAQKYNMDANATRTAVDRGASESYKNKSNAGAGIGIAGGLFVLWIIFKIILSIARNN